MKMPMTLSAAAVIASLTAPAVEARTGRAVSREAGLPYQDKLFSLPAFLRGETDVLAGDVLAGLKLTGYFLERHVLGPRAIAMPAARSWLADGLANMAAAA